MPYAPSGHGIEIFYEILTTQSYQKGDHGENGILGRLAGAARASSADGVVRVVLVAGLAADRHMWRRQAEGLFGSNRDPRLPQVELMILDNRGIGKSSEPKDKRLYSIALMASDVLAAVDHAGWGSFHLVGHSMGSCIALYAAAQHPRRILSLLLLAPVGWGGIWSIPSLRGLLLAAKSGGAKTNEQRVDLDLQCHYSTAFLDERVPGGATRRSLLREEYLQNMKDYGRISACGERGQVRAVVSTWRLKKSMLAALLDAKVPCAVVSGYNDIICKATRGLDVAKRIRAVVHMTSAGHFVSIESCHEVNVVLVDLILNHPAGSRDVEAGPYADGAPLHHVVLEMASERSAGAESRQRSSTALRDWVPLLWTFKGRQGQREQAA